MMKRYAWILVLLLLTVFVLTACGLGVGGGEQTKEEALAPLRVEAWPTAQPTAALATPTPFPKVTLAPTATPTAGPDVGAFSTPLAESSLGSGLETLVKQAAASAAAGGLTPVATGLVIADNVSVRAGPGASYAVVSSILRGEPLAVFGKNSSGDWLYVLSSALLPGWLPIEVVRVVGSVEKAPVLPPNPLASLATSSSALAPAATQSAPAAANPVASQPSPPGVIKLEPVTTGRVDNFALNMRQGPGAAYGQLGTLSRDEKVNVLALNKTRDWVLIEAANGQQGWVSLDYLALDGPVDDAPVVISPRPDQPLPAGQVAPFTLPNGTIVKPAVEDNQAAPAGQGSQPIEPEQASYNSSAAPPGNPSVAVADLKPVATALIGRSEVALLPGPSSEYVAFKRLTQDDEKISILGLDKSGNWALVDPAFSNPGWIVLADLKIVDGSVANAPQVATGWVQSNGVEVRSGPGIYYDLTGGLAINSLVQVVGLNKGRSWALVSPVTGGGLGWTQVQLLTIPGSLAELPEAPALPAPEPDNGAQAALAAPIPAKPLSQTKLVFQLSSGGDIMVINGDGTGLRRLTNGIDPVLSPDGQSVAFTRWEGESGSLWTISLDGSNEKSVLGFIKQAKGPDWSPDGSKIVLNYQHGGRLEEKKDCYDLDEKGGPPRPPREARDIRVVLDSNFQPQICWNVPPDPHWGLRVVNLADSSFEDVDGGTYAFRPAWDPSQAWRIISDGGRGLVQVDINAGSPNQMITDNVNDGSPVFSPDGRYLAVVAGPRGGGPGYDIHRMNANGSGRVQLTKTPLWVTSLPDKQKAWNNVAPTWSPDGSQIAFLTDRNGRWEIWVMNVDGSNQRPMFSDEINNQLNLTYNFVDERALSWR